ncbi:retrovirus-related pol poly from transposon [Octopus vulgaris]|uniref:Retrovirus-related pol poly from transposon n=1 Tax=Octopus vulgaris TaxID=6645 RepID=A0AA36AUF3_OCTVU|nr:retrovirus-related pol poly from transposon [Octopus vulgaris]
MAAKQSLTYTAYTPCGSISLTKNIESEVTSSTTAAVNTSKCFFCGYFRHPSSKCPAQNAICKRSAKKGHFLKVCQSKPNSMQSEFVSAMDLQLNTAIIAVAPTSLSKAIINISVNDASIKALVDTGSFESYICSDLAKSLELNTYPSEKKISMASTKLSNVTKEHCFVKLFYQKSSA